MRIFVAIVVLVLAGCAIAPISPQEQSQCGARPTEAEMAGDVQVYVSKTDWKDADSVRVRNIQLKGCTAKLIGDLLNGGKRYVGWEIDFEVNAKNGFGGYAGFEPRSIIKIADGMIRWNLE